MHNEHPPMLKFCKSKSILAVALFLLGQAFLAAHGIEHGNEPHKHNGVVCFTALSDERDDLLPPAKLGALNIAPTKSVLRLPAHQFFAPKNSVLRPPSTGPPSDSLLRLTKIIVD